MLNRVSSTLLLAICVTIFVKCDNYEFPSSPYPRIETLPAIGISEAGVTLQAKINRIAKKPMIDHGFVWGFQENFAINNLQKISLGPVENITLFETEVNHGLYPDTTYYVKAFVQTESYFVYGEAVSFNSKGSTPPLISNLRPSEGTWGDTIKISGRYFSTRPSNNLVRFASVEANVISSTDSTILCIVPEGLVALQVPLSVSVASNRSLVPAEFSLTTPHIDHYGPAEGTFGDVVTITGSNFGSGLDKNRVMFNDKVAEVIEASKTVIKVKVPTQIMSKENEISVTLNLQEDKADRTFRILPPYITNISTTAGYVNGIVEIVGDNFNPAPVGNIVLFGNNSARVLSATRQSLTVELPDAIYSNRTNHFELTLAQQTAVSSEALTLKDAWMRKADSPMTDWPVVTFAIDGKAYFLSGDETWRYNPKENTWDHVAVYPGEKSLGQLSFVINDIGYVCLGSNMYSNAQTEFWRFDPATNTWRRNADFPFETSSATMALSAGGKGYIAMDFGDIGLWEYDPEADVWGQRGPYLNGHIAGNLYLAAAGFSIDDRLFIYLADGTTAPNPLFEFDFLTEKWINRGHPEANDVMINTSATGFSLEGKGYIRGTRTLYVFDPSTNNWQTRAIDRLGELWDASAFVIDKKAYVVGSYLGDRYSLWEFDPAYDVP